MKRSGTKHGVRTVVALALTWDGARWPVRSLPPKARSFLGGSKSLAAPSTSKMARLFAQDHISEIRICWMPRLKGGDDVLAGPFSTPEGKRLPFRATHYTRIGDILGVVYRR